MSALNRRLWKVTLSCIRFLLLLQQITTILMALKKKQTQTYLLIVLEVRSSKSVSLGYLFRYSAQKSKDFVSPDNNFLLFVLTLGLFSLKQRIKLCCFRTFIYSIATLSNGFHSPIHNPTLSAQMSNFIFAFHKLNCQCKVKVLEVTKSFIL